MATAAHGREPEPTALVLPRPASEMFPVTSAASASGKGVQVMPVDAELTAQQAADLMRASDAPHVPQDVRGRDRVAPAGLLLEVGVKLPLDRERLETWVDACGIGGFFRSERCDLAPGLLLPPAPR
ncbi:hypothetical protein ACH4ZX_09400 [Streptomyces sp. NPDC020490]|uniref:hypothetical protein n=1 Tax=Streptomyces sp. NPDC020490 TaxID=3365078 RepID=UPI003795DF68